jgi:hypothetical protein
MNLNISTDIDFVTLRTEKTSALVTTLAALPQPWVSSTKSAAAWVADVEQLDGAKPGTLAQIATAATTDKAIRVSAMEARYGIIHARTLQAVGVMRSRALADSTLRPVVDELSARGDSRPAIEDEGEELLAAWSQEFGEDFIPGDGNTYSAFAELFEGNANVPSLRKLKSDHKESTAKARRAAGNFNALINRLEDECVQWYAEATAVFPEGTTHGDLIRGQIPTSYHPVSPAPVPVPTPA